MDDAASYNVLAELVSEAQRDVGRTRGGPLGGRVRGGVSAALGAPFFGGISSSNFRVNLLGHSRTCAEWGRIGSDAQTGWRN